MTENMKKQIEVSQYATVFYYTIQDIRRSHQQLKKLGVIS